MQIRLSPAPKSRQKPSFLYIFVDVAVHNMDSFSIGRIIVGILLKISIGFFVLITFIVITKLKIEITYKHDRDNDLLMVRFYAWKVRWYTFKAPLIEVDKNSPSIVINKKARSTVGKNKEKVRVTPKSVMRYINDMRRILAHIVDFKRIIIRFLRRVHIENFEWKSRVGTVDAAMTGKIIGVIWSFKGSLVGLLSHYLQLKQMPNLDVQADFQNNQSKTSFSCMISFRLGHAIIAVLMVVKHWKRKPMMYRTSEQVTS